MRSIRRLLLPEGVLVAAALVVTRVDSLRSGVADAAPTALAIALGIGALLSLRFHRGRMLLVLLLLGLSDRALTITGIPPAIPDRLAYGFVALLLPLNLMAFALLPERGALTTPGLARLVTVGLEGAAVAFAASLGTEGLAAALERPLLASLTTWTPVPQLGVALGAAALLLFLILWARQPTPIARGLFWAQVAILMALHEHGLNAATTSTWFATAGLVLAFAVLESSYALAYHDGLTGLPGRRALNEALHQLGDRYTVAMADVDHFKACNDRWGHDVGDEVLRMVASRLEGVGGGGRAFRYGGEEFAVLFPGLRPDDVRPHLEALREEVEGSSFALRRRPRPRRKPARRKTRDKLQKIAVTISIGLAESDGRSPPEAIVQAADRALYQAKENGRNRVEG